MSENFPFDTADDFLSQFEEGNNVIDNEPIDVDTDTKIHVPDMPNTTQVQSSARLGSGAVLALAAYTQETWVLLAAVIAVALIEIARIYADMRIREARNARIAIENDSAMNASAHVKAAAIEAHGQQ